MKKKNYSTRVRYIVEYWFKSSELYDTLESARRQQELLKTLPQYKEIRIVRLTEEEQEVV